MPGYGVSITNCANVTSGALGNVRGRLERRGAVAGQPEDERAEDVHAVLAELAQTLHQFLTGVVEALVDVLEALRASPPRRRPARP